ncbi:DprA-like DNA recombination-mediator protein [Pseudomonas phage 201phi2-1]|uniref:Uncharacterized protein n=1 Tax=Pseudomonas phage 201phi2-1 TaxID=198110 RepID=B3FJI1_BP201|nr:DprA-like DNA recombination-mediator protein [Pseudomonas phage 201phi2-1]ABY63146.1 hypothetical protein 201phi2-1p321 [Pseudomonas phage 201phi2-1]
MESKGCIAIVGSREVPLDELELLIRLGRTFTDLGYEDSSGDAFGSDRAGWVGARQSDRYDPHSARIYLVDSIRNRKRALEHGFKIAQDYPENWVTAEAIALKARGSWNGIDGPHNQFKRDLHIRNVFQILGHSLIDPAKALVYYAPPVGRLEREVVSGGTNTALQIAKTVGIEKRYNLATKAGYDWANEFLKQYETEKEYEEIDWREILKPDDPRLSYL